MSQEKLALFQQRKSVRKFTDDPVPTEVIRELIQTATQAPSGKNLQNWHFVVLRNREKIQKLAEIVIEKNASLAQYISDEKERNSFTAFQKYHTVFKNAPALILVYAGPYPTIADTLDNLGTLPEDELKKLYQANPGVQNIAAALENLLLAATALGYGTCWMTGPTYAAEEISRYIGFEKEGYYLAAMTPLGIPSQTEIVSPPRKSVDEVTTFID